MERRRGKKGNTDSFENWRLPHVSRNFPLLFVSSILKERPRYLLTFDGATIACLPMYAMHPRVTHRIARTTHRVYIYIYVCVRARGVVNSRIDN